MSSVTLVGSDGFIYPDEYDGRDGRLELAHFRIGETSKGWVTFVIPEKTAPWYIKFKADIFAGNYLLAGLG